MSSFLSRTLIRGTLVLGTFAMMAPATLTARPTAKTSIQLSHGWSRATAAGQRDGGGFLTIANNGSHEDRLIGGNSPVAATVQVHSMTMDHSIMRMREVTGGLPIPAHGTVTLAPGGYHLMLIGLRHPLKPGESVPLTLRFAHGGSARLMLAVQAAGATGAMPMDHKAMNHAGMKQGETHHASH